jgi:hypothetical protein
MKVVRVMILPKRHQYKDIHHDRIPGPLEPRGRFTFSVTTVAAAASKPQVSTHGS